MNWLLTLLMAILVPALQPVVNNGVQRMQAKIVTQQQPQPHIVFHEGRWWKYDQGQWYVWTQTPAQERLAWGQQQWPSNIR